MYNASNVIDGCYDRLIESTLYLYFTRLRLVCRLLAFFESFTIIPNASIDIWQNGWPIARNHATNTKHKIAYALLQVPYPSPQEVGGGEAAAHTF